MINVTVVIPNYNGMKFIKPCLDSLMNQDYKDYAVLVVDNASSDGSLQLIKEEYPSVEVVSLDKNYGFSEAVNIGIEKSQTKYVLLLNNDTEVDSSFVGSLVEAISSSDKIFSCSSKMISYSNRNITDDAGDLLNIFGWAFQRGVGRKVEKYTKRKRVFSACAGAAIYRKDVFEKIGVFDLMHFAYLEDIDVGYRARIEGFRNEYAPKALVYHIGSATSGSKYNDFKVKLAARNNIYLFYKNMPLLQLVINLPFLLLGMIIKYFFFVKKGFGKAYINGIGEGLVSFSKCKKVKLRMRNIPNYLIIEFELLINTFIYAKELFLRRLGK